MPRKQQVQSAHQLVPFELHVSMRREMVAFFKRLTSQEHGGFEVPQQAFVDALADSLFELGLAKEKAESYVETLAIELRERAEGLKHGFSFWPGKATRFGLSFSEGAKLARFYAGRVYWTLNDTEYKGEIARACFGAGALLIEGHGLMLDGSRYGFSGRLERTEAGQYEGRASCVMPGREWDADVSVQVEVDGDALTLDGKWEECEETTELVSYALYANLRSLL